MTIDMFGLFGSGEFWFGAMFGLAWGLVLALTLAVFAVNPRDDDQ